MIADYPHFLVLARRAQWDEADVDLQPDAAAWPGLDPGVRLRLERLVAGFCVGEAGVAEHLGPFGAAAQDPDAARCFAVQESDERRHSAFFDRVARDVLAVPGATPEERRSALAPAAGAGVPRALRGRACPGWRERSRAATGTSSARSASTTWSWRAWCSRRGSWRCWICSRSHPELPGLKDGMQRVLRDERWHVGFGGRCLQDQGLRPEDVTDVLREGEAARARVGRRDRRRAGREGRRDAPAAPQDGRARLCTGFVTKAALCQFLVSLSTNLVYIRAMERGESPQSRARVIIVSQRTRGAGSGRPASSATLSLVPRWTSDRAVSAAARRSAAAREGRFVRD